MTAGPNGAAQAAPQPGAALPRYAEQRFTVLACGHARVIACRVDLNVPLWCHECGQHRPQAPEPHTPEQAYALAAARHEYAYGRLVQVRALLAEAEADTDAAEAALAELAHANGGTVYSYERD